MSDNIPFEMQAEIIKRLPVKSLLRFRSVSKPWKIFIDSPKLTSSYGIHHTKSHRLIIRNIDAFDSRENCVSFVDDDTFAPQTFVHTVPALVKLLEHSRVIGCSHGLLCMHGHIGYNSGRNNMVVLWNMSIRKSIGIVVPGLFDSQFVVSLGFGVCPVSNDPMIVKFTYVDPYWQRQNKVSLPWQVHVFTLSSGSWKSLSKNLPCGTMTINRYQVVIDRFIYWVAYDDLTTHGDGQDQSRNFIISFDISTKEFKVVDLFDTLGHKSSILSISKLGESLALVEHERNNEKHVCVVWMMEDLVTKSFTKLFTFGTHLAMPRTLAFRKNGELIIEYIAHINDERQARLVAYEPSSELISDLLFYGKMCSFFVSSYVETLLLLDQVDCSILETLN